MNPLLYRHLYSPLKELHRDFNQVLHRVWDDHNNALFSEAHTLTPIIDIEETEQSFIIQAELPGIKEQDISLEIYKGILTLKGEKKQIVQHQEHTKDRAQEDSSNQNKNQNKSYHIRERSYGYFLRSIQLPRLVKEQDIIAEFDNGVLTITVSKVIEEENKAQKIAISKSSSSATKLSINENNNESGNGL